MGSINTVMKGTVASPIDKHNSTYIGMEIINIITKGQL